MHLQNAYNLEEYEIVSLEEIRVFTQIQQISLILLVYSHYADKINKAGRLYHSQQTQYALHSPQKHLIRSNCCKTGTCT
jgi:hypothetical protein